MTRRCLVLTVLLLAAFAGPARAVGPELGIADDRVLTQSANAPATAAIAAWKALGVDSVRTFVSWQRVSPGISDKTKPGGFNPSNPNDPKYDFATVDLAVARIRAAGLNVILSITGPGPLWTSSKPSLGKNAWEPNAADYGAFVSAVAKRYRGKVHQYVLWNEPNQPASLYPQATCVKHRGCTAVAPHIYRNLIRAGYPAIKAVDPSVPVLIGALAPRGNGGGTSASVTSPLTFLRLMGCVNAKFQKLRNGMCKGFQPATGDGLAYHAYGITNRPDQPFAGPNDADLASLPNLEATVDRLQRMAVLKATTQRFGIYIDEYGYQTNPPDPSLGVTPGQQDLFLQQGAYLAWRDPRVKLFSQYIWIDEPVRDAAAGNYSGFQSGLRYVNGTPKPALAHFATPIFYDAKRGQLWGQERPGGKHTVTVQRRLKGSSTWTTLKAVVTDSRGYWGLGVTRIKGATYRFTDGSVVSGSTIG